MPMTALVIDDHPILRTLTSRALRELDWNVVVVPAAAAGVDLIDADTPIDVGAHRHHDARPRRPRRGLRTGRMPSGPARGLHRQGEWAEARILLRQAAVLRSIGARPLVVVTPAQGAQPGWLALQAEMVALLSRGAQQVAPNATHTPLVDTGAGAAVSIEAIQQVVQMARRDTVAVNADSPIHRRGSGDDSTHADDRNLRPPP